MKLNSLLFFAAVALVHAAEPGWIDLTTLKGWTRIPIPATAQLNPENQWSFDAATRTIRCSGDKGHEMLRSDKQYLGYDLHVEWRFKKLDGDPQPRYNSGIFVRSSADGEYFVQAQAGAGPAVWLFADYPKDGKKTRLNLKDKMTAEKTLPPGNWNTYDVGVHGGVVSLAVNGERIFAFQDVPQSPPGGYIGLEAEGFDIEFRNVRIKPSHSE
ncbi:MAG: DUF1080 domain-containing protein [Bryobacteraceae bacterium]|nr:DUF1080 domain-containing protein [Bryobacteraceae bacterium]